MSIEIMMRSSHRFVLSKMQSWIYFVIDISAANFGSPEQAKTIRIFVHKNLIKEQDRIEQSMGVSIVEVIN